MDLLQIALIILIAVISFIFLVGGWMVFFILKDMHKALKKLNEVLYGSSLAANKSRALLKAKAPQKRFFKRG